MSKYAKRKDTNQREIEKDLDQLPGISWFDSSRLGFGFPDLVVGFRNRNYLFEIKDPEKVPSKQKLTKSEDDFHLSWRGQIDVVTTVEEILQIIDYVIIGD